MDSKGGQATEYRSEPFAASADGRYVAFTSASPNLTPDDTNNTWDVLVRDRRIGTRAASASPLRDLRATAPATATP